MEIITRLDAAERGLKRYFSGKPCTNGHESPRFVSNGMCIACLKDHQQKYRTIANLKTAGLTRITLDIHPDDEKYIRDTVEALRIARQMDAAALIPPPDTTGNHKVMSASGLPPVPDSKPDWFVP